MIPHSHLVNEHSVAAPLGFVLREELKCETAGRLSPSPGDHNGLWGTEKDLCPDLPAAHPLHCWRHSTMQTKLVLWVIQRPQAVKSQGIKLSRASRAGLFQLWFP